VSREAAGGFVMSDARVLGVSVVGAGYWGPNLVRNFTASPRWNVVSVVDKDAARASMLARRFPGVAVESDVEQALRVGTVDAVAIATPVETHYAIAKAALNAGKHVLVEKPLTLTSAQGEELCALAEARGLTLMVDHTFLYTGAVELLRKIVQSEDFGEVLYVDSVRVNLGLFQSNVNVIYDLAPHDISIFGYILGEDPISVAVQAAACIHSDMHDVAFITLRYPSGVLAHVHVSWLSPVKQRLFTVAGRNRMALWDDVEPSEKVRIYDKGVDVRPNPESNARRMVSYRTGDMYAPALDSREALGKILDDFHDAILEGCVTRASGRDGLMVVRVLEATDRSLAEGGRAIDLLSGARL
jgi:predicted dehydrogenase